MAVKHALTTRNAQAQAIETDFGASPILEIRSGSPPATPEAGPSGTLLASMTLPADAFSVANGVLSMNGSWTTPGAVAGGTAGHYSINTSGGVPKEVGTVAISGGDMNIDNTSVAIGQSLTVNTYDLTMGNA